MIINYYNSFLAYHIVIRMIFIISKKDKNNVPLERINLIKTQQ